jgi:hypothetical protein
MRTFLACPPTVSNEPHFAEKLQRGGLENVWVRRKPVVRDRRANLIPLFMPEVTALMRRTIPAEHHDRIGTAVIIKAVKPRP